LNLEFVRAADHTKILKPPYQAVKLQEATSRGRLMIVDATLWKDQLLVLRTDPHPSSARYALTIPGVKARGAKGSGDVVDLDYDLSGVETVLREESVASKLPRVIGDLVREAEIPALSDSRVALGWRPHPDGLVTKSFVGGFEDLLTWYAKQKPRDADESEMSMKLRMPNGTAIMYLRSEKIFDAFALRLGSGPDDSELRVLDVKRTHDGRYVAEIDPRGLTPEAQLHVRSKKGAAPVATH
jgi:hypothetical protein